MSQSHVRLLDSFINVRCPSPRGRSERTQARFANRRTTKDGFPWSGKFETVEEIEDYLAGDKIVCLECGKMFRAIGTQHLARIHGMTCDDYREKYGLPWRRGLLAAASSALKSTIVKNRLANPAHRERLLAIAERARELCPPGKRSRSRPAPPAIKAMHTQKVLNKQPPEYFNKHHADEILRRIETGRTLPEVLRDADMPRPTWWHSFCRRHQEYKVRLRAIMDDLPFAVQARAEMLGRRFQDSVLQCFLAGMSDREAAAKLGVTTMTVNRFTKPLRERRRARAACIAR